MCFSSEPVETIEVPESEALIGYRSYVLRGGWLWPTGGAGPAHDRVSEAQCGRQRSYGHAESAPQQDCTCGIHAYATRQHQVRGVFQGAVDARVKLWGRVVKHGSEGYRAQFCQVLAFAPGRTVRAGCSCSMCSAAWDA